MERQSRADKGKRKVGEAPEREYSENKGAPVDMAERVALELWGPVLAEEVRTKEATLARGLKDERDGGGRELADEDEGEEGWMPPEVDIEVPAD